MASPHEAIEKYKRNAEIHNSSEALCKQKSLELLEELSLPKGLLPLDDLTEIGYNREAGFIWLKQKKKKEHFFSCTGATVSYVPEVTAFVEKHRMKKLTGVKAKKFLFWVYLSTEIYIDDDPSNYGAIFCKLSGGLSFPLPVSAFEEEEKEDDDDDDDDDDEKREN
ncbi:Protein of unknown function DUF538 [Macleaya cordata]|uniref:DUF538 domain-containing protein n=1 Tax=Macleaya cordata TaxID=56857 RepID=A0A200PNW7_MACCD|nr:Protein of unknown function DUF538 [Macleaya cordata]